MARHFYFSQEAVDRRRLEWRRRLQLALLLLAAVTTMTLVWLAVGGKF